MESYLIRYCIVPDPVLLSPDPLWYRTGFVVVSYRILCGKVLDPLWYRTGSVVVSYRIRCGIIPDPLWYRTGSVVVSYLIRCGIVPDPLWYRTGSVALDPLWIQITARQHLLKLLGIAC